MKKSERSGKRKDTVPEKTIAGRKSRSKQTKIWGWADDIPIKSYEMARPYIGAFFEEVCRVFTGGQALKTEAGKLCPDLELDGSYIECKSIGKNPQCYLYEHRIEAYAPIENRLSYCFMFHNVSIKEHKSLHGLRRALAESLYQMAFVPATAVHEAALQGSEKLISYSSRDARAWSKRKARLLTRRWFRLWTTGQPEIGFMPEKAHGQELPAVPVFRFKEGQ